MRTMRSVMLIFAVLVLESGLTLAHHDFIAQFDPDKLMTLRGTLTKVEWINPHGWIYLNVKDANGQLEPWAVETGTTYRLTKGGLKSTDFKFGMAVVVEGFAARDGSRKIAGKTLSFTGREGSFPLGR
jgi:hypothetical protein